MLTRIYCRGELFDTIEADTDQRMSHLVLTAMHHAQPESVYHAVWYGGWWIEWPDTMTPYPNPANPPADCVIEPGDRP